MAVRDARATASPADDSMEVALKRSKEFVRHMLSHDFDWCVDHVARDFLWVGARREQYACGQQDFRTLLESHGGTMLRASITDEEYTVASTDEHTGAVVGRFLVITPADDDHLDAVWYRCTFIWRVSGRKFLLSHLHVSSPSDFVEKGDNYPIHAGTETYRYMKSLMRLGSSRKNVSIYDANGTVHWVHPSQIIYLEANRKRTVVHCMTKEIVVPAVIRDAVDMVGDKIMRVHRSYAVNRDHVVELKGGRLLLDDGTSIAIPAKRLADVRAQLTVN